MTTDFEHLKKWIAEMAANLEKDEDPEPQFFASFLYDTTLALQLIDLINSLDETQVEEESSYYSACVFALDICVAQLQAALESDNKSAGRIQQSLMNHLAKAIASYKHTLSFWLPVLNSFYDVHTELSEDLREAYLELASQEDEPLPDEDIDHLGAIQDMIAELSDLSSFDIADHIFAQSHAMPEDFFADLVIDLYNLEEGQDIALLALLHPRHEVRELVIDTHEHLMTHITMTSQSLTRLQIIKNWYPNAYHEQFNRWIKIQRMKGVVFNNMPEPAVITRIKASEVDGTGAQGLFIHVKNGKMHQLCGLLFKQDVGIKDAWVTPPLTRSEIERYYSEAFDGSVTLRDVDHDYLSLMTSHFLALTIHKNNLPDLHFLEILELSGLHFPPESMDIPDIIAHLAIQISPFTQESMKNSFKRSKQWLTTKQFTESWYIENAHIDKLVNGCSSFVDGVKVCDIDKATGVVFAQEFELHRDKWLFHFLWISLWIKANTRKNAKVWQDAFFLAYAINSGMPLIEIPVMQEIGRQSIYNSIETMNVRRTHLAQQ